MSSIDKKHMLSSQLYKANDPELQKARLAARLITEKFNRTSIEDIPGRTELLRQLFGKMGAGTYIEPPLRLDYGKNVTVGENFYANYETIMLDVGKITIGDNVMFGPRVSLLTAGHPTVADVRLAGYEYGYPITIKDNAWLGGDVTVCPGVTIGKNAVIGAGSVVVKDIPDNMIAVGNPCKPIRELNAEDEAKWQAQRKTYDDELAALKD